MFTVVETAVFLRMAQGVLGDEELDEFKLFIATNPEAGDVIPGVPPLRKVRWKRQGIGKRGGTRVIYFNRLASGEVVLIAAYAKAKFDNLPTDVLKMWKDAFNA